MNPIANRIAARLMWHVYKEVAPFPPLFRYALNARTCILFKPNGCNLYGAEIKWYI